GSSALSSSSRFQRSGRSSFVVTCGDRPQTLLDGHHDLVSDGATVAAEPVERLEGSFATLVLHRLMDMLSTRVLYSQSHPIKRVLAGPCQRCMALQQRPDRIRYIPRKE